MILIDLTSSWSEMTCLFLLSWIHGWISWMGVTCCTQTSFIFKEHLHCKLYIQHHDNSLTTTGSYYILFPYFLSVMQKWSCTQSVVAELAAFMTHLNCKLFPRHIVCNSLNTKCDLKIIRVCVSLRLFVLRSRHSRSDQWVEVKNVCFWAFTTHSQDTVTYI